MSANAYARIAERYQTPPLDDEAVERFFLYIAPLLSHQERAAIVAELITAEEADELTSASASVPSEVPTFSIDDAPPIARPRSVDLKVVRVSGWEQVLCVEQQETVRGAVRRMTEAKSGVVGVWHHEQLVGVLTEHDVITRVVAEGLNPDDTSVSEVMTRVN